MSNAAYSIAPARYSKDNFIVQAPSSTGYKTRAARLIGDGLNCRYTNREQGYVASANKVKKFEKLLRRRLGCLSDNRRIVLARGLDTMNEHTNNIGA